MAIKLNNHSLQPLKDHVRLLDEKPLTPINDWGVAAGYRLSKAGQLAVKVDS